MRAIALALLIGSGCMWLCAAQPPGGGGPPGGGPPGDDARGGRRGRGPEGGPPRRWELGTVLPPHARRSLKLTAEQEVQIKTIEADVKSKLDRILTAEQKKTLAEAGPPSGMRGGGPGGLGGPPDDGPGGPPSGDTRKGRLGGDKKGPPQTDKDEQTATPTASIQWYATLDRGLAEAKRTGKPILFLSAAPHCGGIPGMW